MALILVGGQAKHVGKTTLVCNIIRAFPQFGWTAVKVTSHMHSASHTQPLAAGAGWTISEQLSGDQVSDTGRFLQAGALQSVLLFSQPQALAEACSTLLRYLSKSEKAIVESSSALSLLRPALSLLVIDPGGADFKASAREQLRNVHALVAREGRTKTTAGSVEIAGNTPIVQSKVHGLDPDLTRMLEAVLVT